MLVVGAVAVVFLCLIAGNGYWTNHSVHRAMNDSELRNGQLNSVNLTMQAHLTLMLAAMDSIIDKNKGGIDADQKSIFAWVSGSCKEGTAWRGR
jgi:hypothetical protein